MEELVGFKKTQLSEKTRENFIGVIVWAEYPCKCPVCQRGQKQLGREVTKVHLIIKPLNNYDNLQHAWYAGKTIWSSFGGFVLALNDLLGFEPESESVEEQIKEVKEYLMGNRAFEFTSEQPAKFVSMVLSKEIPANLPEGAKKAREQWFPIHEYSPEEIKKMFGVDIVEMQEIGKREVEDLFEQVEKEMEFFEEQIE